MDAPPRHLRVNQTLLSKQWSLSQSAENIWNSLEVPRISEIDMTNIPVGYPEDDKLTIVLNYVLLIAKYHIYKQKQNKSQPFLPLMLIELKNQLTVDENINIKMELTQNLLMNLMLFTVYCNIYKKYLY